MARKVIWLVLAVIYFAAVSSSFAEVIALNKIVKVNSAPVKVYVKGFANESGKPEVIPDEFKKYFEDAVRNRKSVKFQVVKASGESDLQVSGIIKKYMYSETDPINSFAGAGGLLLDAATTENYAEITVEFTVADSKTGAVIWKNDVVSYVERSMTPAESLPLVYEKVSRKFLVKSFGKPK